MERFAFDENGLHLVLEVSGVGEVRLMHLGPDADEPGRVPKAEKGAYRIIQLQCVGGNQDGTHGMSHIHTQPGTLLRYLSHQDVRTPQGRKLMITQAAQNLYVTSYIQFYDGIPAIRSWTVVRNTGTEPCTLSHVSSFALTGLDRGPWQEDALSIPRNSWCHELDFQRRSLEDWGLYDEPENATTRVARASCGTWPSGETLPAALYENGTYAMTWQIEHNGSWVWELAPQEKRLSLSLSGPSFQEGHWLRPLLPGESFTTVPVAVAFGPDADGAFAAMTAYRRRIRRPNEDNIKLPIIFNDYMNCLWGDPTTEKERPLIEAAARAGCEVYCIDCGWYAAGPWWDGVGEWQTSPARFPGGLSEVVGLIRDKGMVPGIWLEIEVMGIYSPLVETTPKNWFFQIDGVPVIDHGRYQLDFRNPEVVSHADRVIDRLVTQEGIGYIKMDYNINAGPGTSLDAHSVGDGLLEHNRAYLAWLDRVFARYPWLTIESCASGGQRIEYALLSRHSLQSLTDQTDYRRLSLIAAAAPSVLTPEQSAAWCYPMKDQDREAVVMNVVNALLLRVHLSGQLADLDPESFALVRKGMELYKLIREDLRDASPFWPVGLPRRKAGWHALGLQRADTAYLAVWRGEGEEDTLSLPLPRWKGQGVQAECVYPDFAEPSQLWDPESGILQIRHPRKQCARLYRLRGDTKDSPS